MSWTFFIGVVAAYGGACAAWLLAQRLRPRFWAPRFPLRTDRRWLDAALVFVVAAAILGLGRLWARGLLLPEPAGVAGDLLWNANNLIIYAPLFVVLAARRQSPRTIYLSAERLPVKLATGLVLGLGAAAVYLVLQGEPSGLPRVALEAVQRKSLRNALPVFLEGAVLAFAFVRLRWALGLWPALLVPGVLFALAHVPRQIESGLAAPEMLAHFVLTSGVAAAVLFVLERSQDILWLGGVHYLMDVAIDAFS